LVQAILGDVECRDEIAAALQPPRGSQRFALGCKQFDWHALIVH
jgi:hypothetical protein